ncbi:hypothetical protein IIC68_03945, partial [archaeon]|nr:hypothetical protein [archaeon]
MKIRLNKILKKGKALYLAYDQGLEHGPESDFNDKNVDPLYILDIAKKGKYQGIVFQKGIAEKYQKEIKKSKVHLILKLNGKTKLYKGEPYSAPLGTVEEAVKLGASAVGYTLYIGSAYEARMFKEFERIEKNAHSKGLPVVTWIYPRGKNIKNDVSRENMVYAARTGLEVGADIAKIKGMVAKLDNKLLELLANGASKEDIEGLKVEIAKLRENTLSSNQLQEQLGQLGDRLKEAGFANVNPISAEESAEKDREAKATQNSLEKAEEENKNMNEFLLVAFATLIMVILLYLLFTRPRAEAKQVETPTPDRIGNTTPE